MTLAEKISYLRKRAGISQEELAERLSISRQSVYKWESGESQPNYDKIKAISKMFNVSFDYLLDDSIESPDPTSEIGTSKPLQRPVFYTGKKLDENQVNIDNGYSDLRKTKIKDMYHLPQCVSVSEQALTDLGIKDTARIHPVGVVDFFYDPRNQTCGFFYAGMVQFVCPIENILGFTYGGGSQKVFNSTATVSTVGIGGNGINSIGFGSMPTMSVHHDTTAWAVLTYKNGDSIEDLELHFSVYNRPFLEYTCYSWEQMVETQAMFMESLLKNLEQLRLKLSALHTVGQEILSGKTKVEEIDYTPIIEANKTLEENYSAYLSKIDEEAESDNSTQLMVRLIFGTLTGIVVFAIIAVLFQNL